MPDSWLPPGQQHAYCDAASSAGAERPTCRRLGSSTFAGTTLRVRRSILTPQALPLQPRPPLRSCARFNHVGLDLCKLTALQQALVWATGSVGQKHT